VRTHLFSKKSLAANHLRGATEVWEAEGEGCDEKWVELDPDLDVEVAPDEDFFCSA
jgi:hypothetical protein